jgi:ADP-heptose:LPS heptosyltransferase
MARLPLSAGQLVNSVRRSAVTVACYALRPVFALCRPGKRAATPRRIVVLRRCCLGDVLMTTPLLASLDAAFPEASITYACGAWSAAALGNNPHVDRVVTLPDRWDRAAWRGLVGLLRRERFDLAVIPERSPLPGVAAALAGIPRRVGLDSTGRGFALTDRVPMRGIRHETDLALDLARALGVGVAERRLRYFPSEAAVARIAALLAERGTGSPLLVVHPGGAANPGVRMDTKRWRPERFAAVADALAGRHGATIVIAGAPGDREAVASMRAALRREAIDLAGTLSLDEHAALCARADLYIGNDTGTTHLAGACGAPVVAVFGPTDPAQSGPVDGVGEAVWDPVACGPHVQRGDLTRVAITGETFRCIDAITVEQVLDVCERVMARAARDVASGARP